VHQPAEYLSLTTVCDQWIRIACCQSQTVLPWQKRTADLMHFDALNINTIGVPRLQTQPSYTAPISLTCSCTPLHTSSAADTTQLLVDPLQSPPN
jgi:hypothetical protein